MGLKIYNTLTRKKEEFVPIDEEGKRVNMYTCGVTVYDKCHIGHARSLYVFDMIRRYLIFCGYDVNFARNITDVDDKIIRKANELGKEFEEVVRENIHLYEHDLKSLGIGKADFEPRATENIEAMIQHIQGLMDKGFAYESDGDVYFKVRAFKDYGKLSGQSVDQMLEAVRIDQDSKKKDSLDFALWKKAKDGEPFWKSPWGDGRPGWHIECSVMSMKELKCETLDIHAGGLDLQFPHHENEVAQSEALTGKPFAKYWIHHGLLKINGQKMAKSLGNFITVDEAVEKYSADLLKLFFLSSHYTSSVDFSDEKMKEAAKQRDKIVTFLKRAKAFAKEMGSVDAPKVFRYRDEIIQAMDDDFNTAKAWGVIFEFMNEMNKMMDQPSSTTAWEIATALNAFHSILFGIFNLELADEQEDVPEEVMALLKQREEARQNKDFAASDRLRDTLKERGFLVQDTKDGQTWRKL